MRRACARLGRWVELIDVQEGAYAILKAVLAAGRVALDVEERARGLRSAGVRQGVARLQAVGMAVSHTDAWMVEWRPFERHARIGQREQERHQVVLVLDAEVQVVDVRIELAIVWKLPPRL